VNAKKDNQAKPVAVSATGLPVGIYKIYKNNPPFSKTTIYNPPFRKGGQGGI